MRDYPGAWLWGGFVLVLGVWSGLASCAYADDVGLYPADAGVVDVRAYGAKGDGKTDDTAAIQKALDEHPSANRIIFLPNGTYLISDTLRWGSGGGGKEQKRTILQGQSVSGAVLKLKDGCPGFTDPKKGKAMIWTGTKPAQRFRNAVRSLTFDTGKGNPGAIGAQYIANNQGTFHDVRIRSGDGAGMIGLDLGYTNEQGPCLIRNVTVVGFDTGISCKGAVDSITFENITLEGQRKVGLFNGGQCVSIRNLVSRNAVTAVVNADGVSVMTLIDAHLTGGGSASTQPAVSNAGVLLARALKTSGYAQAIQNKAGTMQAPATAVVEEFCSHAPLTLFPGSTRTLGLPVKETPELPWDPLDQWVSPLQFGGKADGKFDNTEAVQKAIDSGKTTLYIPGGGAWRIEGEVLVRGNIRRIIGCEGSVTGKGRFKIVDGSAPVVSIERLTMLYAPFCIEHASRRTVVLRSLSLGGPYEAMPGAGDLFIEDVCGAPWRFARQNVWARQINPENPATKIVNDGGSLWILGLKTEREGTLVETRNGGKSEILGGFAYATSGPKTAPMFINHESSLSVTLGESCFNGKPFTVLIEETRQGQTKQLNKGDAPGRTGGSMLPLYVGAP